MQLIHLCSFYQLTPKFALKYHSFTAFDVNMGSIFFSFLKVCKIKCTILLHLASLFPQSDQACDAFTAHNPPVENH